jgi:hypothetical protein
VDRRYNDDMKLRVKLRVKRIKKKGATEGKQTTISEVLIVNTMINSKWQLPIKIWAKRSHIR